MQEAEENSQKQRQKQHLFSILGELQDDIASVKQEQDT